MAQVCQVSTLTPGVPILDKQNFGKYRRQHSAEGPT
jgi:hypothetical protein